MASESAAATDDIVLRIPRDGGLARAYLLHDLDSAVWSADAAPAASRVLGFDAEAGLIALVDRQGRARRIDLRSADVRTASTARVRTLASVNATEIFGIRDNGRIIRMTPTGDWEFEPSRPARGVFPQRNGSLVVSAVRPSGLRLWLLRPPDDQILDSLDLDGVDPDTAAQAGDRLYLVDGETLVGVTTRDLTRGANVTLSRPAAAVTGTPSGDRIFVALRGAAILAVVDRYSDRVRQQIPLPGEASALRMDPLGRYILARSTTGDSAWLIAIGTGRILRTLPTAWRTDLPAVLGARTIAVVRGSDVMLQDAESGRIQRVVRNGAREFWYSFAWSGFRPRRAETDETEQVPTLDSTPPVPDSPALSTDSTLPQPPLRDAAPVTLPLPETPPQRRYLISLSTLRTEAEATRVAAAIQVPGHSPRVLRVSQGDSTVFRVVVGPFNSREEANRTGTETGQPFWIFEDRQ